MFFLHFKVSHKKNVALVATNGLQQLEVHQLPVVFPCAFRLWDKQITIVYVCTVKLMPWQWCPCAEPFSPLDEHTHACTRSNHRKLLLTCKPTSQKHCFSQQQQIECAFIQGFLPSTQYDCNNTLTLIQHFVVIIQNKNAQQRSKRSNNNSNNNKKREKHSFDYFSLSCMIPNSMNHL